MEIGDKEIWADGSEWEVVTITKSRTGYLFKLIKESDMPSHPAGSWLAERLDRSILAELRLDPKSRYYFVGTGFQKGEIKMTPFVLKTDRTKYDYPPSNGTDYKLKEMQTIVGGFIEILHINDEIIMVLNEDGLSLGLPVNEQANRYCAEHELDCYIVGDVLVCHDSMVK